MHACVSTTSRIIFSGSANFWEPIDFDQICARFLILEKEGSLWGISPLVAGSSPTGGAISAYFQKTAFFTGLYRSHTNLTVSEQKS